MDRNGKRLSETELMVKGILEDNERARESDDVLFFEVCRLIKPNVLEEKLGDVLLDYKGHNIPCYESVGRCRRKIQVCYGGLYKLVKTMCISI